MPTPAENMRASMDAVKDYAETAGHEGLLHVLEPLLDSLEERLTALEDALGLA